MLVLRFLGRDCAVQQMDGKADGGGFFVFVGVSPHQWLLGKSQKCFKVEKNVRLELKENWKVWGYGGSAGDLKTQEERTECE